MVLNGLDRLIENKELQNKIEGNFGYLCHSASVDKNLRLGVFGLKEVFGDRFKKIFGPQHGFVTDVQDNMVESRHYIHPYFNIPILSLYSETRIPTDEMLEGLDTIIVDLQDVGTRVYTYISTLGLLMKKCGEKNIKIVVLDRPNPVGGLQVEGNVLEEGYHSFVGHHKIPQRHGLTMAEVGLLTKKYYAPNCQYDYVLMEGWTRDMYFKDTGLPWVNPSPNLPTMEGAITFCGTVLFEGTNISEGRGTTRSLEVIGHPTIEPFSLAEKFNKEFSKTNLSGFVLRPICFMPTFQKYKDTACGGFHLHVTNPQQFKSWHVSQMLCHLLAKELGNKFEFHQKPYEYEFNRLAIDLINGTDKIRQWVFESGNIDLLEEIERKNLPVYFEQKKSVHLY